MRRALGLADHEAQACFGQMCGGVAGNMVDRVTKGHVVELLDFHFVS
jgi:signal peptidase II